MSDILSIQLNTHYQLTSTCILEYVSFRCIVRQKLSIWSTEIILRFAVIVPQQAFHAVSISLWDERANS